MENFRPGVMDKLGIGYEALSAINPKLIYCAVSGFGQNGPERTTAAYDGKIQAMSGIMSVTGHPGEGPTRAGFAVCDAIAGMTAAFAVSSALFQRTHTGRGQLVDVAMLDATLSFLTTYVTDYTVGGHVQGQLGNRAQSRLPTADVFKVQGRPHPARRQQREAVRRPGEGDRPAGPAQGPALRRLAGAARQRRGAARHHRGRLRRGRRQDLGGAADQGRRALLAGVDHPRDRRPSRSSPIATCCSASRPRYGPQTFVGSGFRLAHGGGRIDRAPALPGAHAEEILEEAGYGEAEIAALRRDGAI